MLNFYTYSGSIKPKHKKEIKIETRAWVLGG